MCTSYSSPRYDIHEHVMIIHAVLTLLFGILLQVTNTKQYHSWRFSLCCQLYASDVLLGHSLCTMSSRSIVATLCGQNSSCQCFSRNDAIGSGMGWFDWSWWDDQVTSPLQALLSVQTLHHELTDKSQYASGYQSFSFPLHGLEDDVFPSLRSINIFLVGPPIQVLQHQQAVSS